MRIYPITPIAQRLWAHVTVTDGCWLWSGATCGKGYGTIYIHARERPRMMTTHRLSWVLANGPIPDGMAVCHTCDTPACVRPDHLWLGSLADNNRDMYAKGRGRGQPPKGRGETHSRTTLTDAQVKNILDSYTGIRGQQAAMARANHVRPAVIQRIVSRQSWTHI